MAGLLRSLINRKIVRNRPFRPLLHDSRIIYVYVIRLSLGCFIRGVVQVVVVFFSSPNQFLRLTKDMS